MQTWLINFFLFFQKMAFLTERELVILEKYLVRSEKCIHDIFEKIEVDMKRWQHKRYQALVGEMKRILKDLKEIDTVSFINKW